MAVNCFFLIKLSTCEFLSLVNIKLNFDRYPSPSVQYKFLEEIIYTPHLLCYTSDLIVLNHIFLSIQKISQSSKLVKQFGMSLLKAVFYKDRIRPTAGTTSATQKYNSYLLLLVFIVSIHS